jgi:tellurite resistance protein TerC
MAVATIASLVKLKRSGTSVAEAIHGDEPEETDDSETTEATDRPAKTTREDAG